MEKERTQTELASELEISKQSVHRACKDLKGYDYICISNELGKNKYLKVNPEPNMQM